MFSYLETTFYVKIQGLLITAPEWWTRYWFINQNGANLKTVVLHVTQ